MQILTDFDYTLTKSHDQFGTKTWTSHGVFDHCQLPLSVDLRGELTKLKDHYYPIEINPDLKAEEKLPHMIEWYYLGILLYISGKNALKVYAYAKF